MRTRLPLVLASASPRRRELLEAMGLSFSVDASDADESLTRDTPEELVKALSRAKARAVAGRHENAYVLAADTIVYLNGVLGKPRTHERATQMLSALSGKWHDVYTGLTLIDTASGRELTAAERTRVHFVPMTAEEIDAYAATEEPLDKAGAYAIQGRGGMFIDRIEGSYSNVVGLPMHAARAFLREMGALS